jgi:hypothetical protein
MEWMSICASFPAAKAKHETARDDSASIEKTRQPESQRVKRKSRARKGQEKRG